MRSACCAPWSSSPTSSIENFSAGVLDQWGAGWSALSSWNDKIIYLSMQGAGVDGPWRDYVTFAPTVHALCGLTALTGPEGRLDCGPGVALNDHVSGLAGALAAARRARGAPAHGRGQHIDLSATRGRHLPRRPGPAGLARQRTRGRVRRRRATAFSDPVPNDVVPWRRR